MQETFGIKLSAEEFLLALLDDRPTLIKLGRRRSQKNDKIVQAWQEQEKTIATGRRDQLAKEKQLRASIHALGIGEKKPEKNLDHVCTWVPAATSTGLSNNPCRFVYGGVSLTPKIQIHNNNPRAQALIQSVTNDPNVVRVETSAFIQQAQKVAQSTPTQQSASSIAQQYRMFQAENVRCKSKRQSL